jgi:hypothetical protein
LERLNSAANAEVDRLVEKDESQASRLELI